jgi:Domain of unknown function (DUF4291)
MSKQILAAYDEEGVFVYQAFKPSIVEAALRNGTFADGFNMERMTWIKPSFGWMLHRSEYATAFRQECVLKIKVRHEGFLTLLRRGVPTTYDRATFASSEEWRRALDRTGVRFQWDPDRALRRVKLERRAIQVGMSGGTVRQYVQEWIVGLEDVTVLAHAIKAAIDKREPELPAVPEERVYEVDAALRRQLGIA